MTGFECRNLASQEARVAYPLVRETMPGLDLKTWMHFVRRIARPGPGAQSGIVAVSRPPRPLPVGLFVYRCEEDLEHGRVLAAEHFVALDLLDARPVTHALVAELDRIARALNCSAIRVALAPGDEGYPHAALHAAGHVARGTLLWKWLGETPGDRPSRPYSRRSV